jgi:hypothetical protein
MRAHREVTLLRLCRAYDTNQQSTLNLKNLLHTAEAHLNIFDEPNFRERLKGNVFVDALAADLKAPDRMQLQADIEAVSTSDPIVHKLVKWRHKYFAHRDREHALQPMKLSTDYPLPFTKSTNSLDPDWK